ncbi:MAG: hypothetical protein CVT69_00135 [Actinobacteria bacterium HGW-Actinobacteria-9]|nr:MAG: hypothetical protein CVT69_00135 [Actinobacteria bacterium HGW-Actinobacteria-9]
MTPQVMRAKRNSSGGRIAAHAMGNLLLGMALGLAVYYGLTDVSARLGQAILRGRLPAAGAELPPTFVESDDDLDMSEWEAQDGAYWDNLADGDVFGRLVINRIGLDVMVVKGHSREALKDGPGWIDYTDPPGQTGNVGIAGHRTTYGAPFRRLDELKLGDTIDLYSPFRRYRYAVSESKRVTPDRVDVMDSTVDPRLTLSACDPPYSARFRLIVTGSLVDVSVMATATEEVTD